MLMLLLACGTAEGPLLTTRSNVPTPVNPVHGGLGTKLIAAGTFTPASVSDLDAIAARLAVSPRFDGMVLGPSIDGVWTQTAVDVSRLSPLVQRLKQQPFDQVKDNFVAVALGSGISRDEANVEFERVILNFSSVAKVARQLEARGIVLDTQTVSGQVFSFPNSGRGRTFAVTKTSMKKRGGEVMRAMLSEFPDIVVVVTVGYAEVFRSVCLDGTSFSDDRYGLLPSFLDGMREALTDAQRLQLVDGFWSAQAVRVGSAFGLFHAAVAFDEAALRSANAAGATSYLAPQMTGQTELFPWVVPATWKCDAEIAKQLQRVMPNGFGLRLDFGPNAFNTADFSQNYHSPQTFSEVVGKALSTADTFVFVSGASVDWWSRPGNVALPSQYAAALAKP